MGPKAAAHPMRHCPKFDASVRERNIPNTRLTACPGQALPRRQGMSESNLEDRAAIYDLFTRYYSALDNGEIEAVADCFTVDAILKSPLIDISGHDEIRAFSGRFAAQRAAGSNFVI